MAAAADLAKIGAAAFAGYVITRAGAILFGWFGFAAVVFLVLLPISYLLFRRHRLALATGLSAGAVLSAVALSL